MNVEESADEAYTFAENSGVTSPVLLDSDGSTYRDYDTSRLPAYAPFPLHVVVDADGTIRYLARQYDSQALFEALDSVVE